MKNKLQSGFGALAVIIIIAVILVAGGGIYYASKMSAPQGISGVSNTSGTGSTIGTLRSLMTIGKDVTCTFSGTNASTTSTGTMYISGTMMSGDFTINTKEAVVNSHIIKQGDVAYVWSGSRGAKITVPAVSATSSSNASPQSQNGVNLDQKVSYDCKDWVKDASKFTIPTDVNFVDLGAMVNKIPGASTSVGAGAGANCSACDRVPAAARQQCKVALGCK